MSFLTDSVIIEIKKGNLLVSELDTKVLIDVAVTLNTAYRSGEELVSNEFWDNVVFPELSSRVPDHELVVLPQGEDFGGDDLGAKGRIKHDIPMLSTDKVYILEEVTKFVNDCYKTAQSIGLSQDMIVFKSTAKLDGIAGRFNRAKSMLLTRGENGYGNDMTRLFDAGVKIIGDSSGNVLGEVITPKSYFAQNLTNDYKTARGMIAGAAKTAFTGTEFKGRILDVLADGAVHLVAYNDLPTLTFSGSELLENLDSIEQKTLDSVDYETDGVVIEVVNEDLKAAMGSASTHHRWQVAKKKVGETAVTKVVDIIWQVGRTGRITPVLIIDPVFLSGATLTRITGHHARNMIDNGINVGSVIRVVRSGEVIPFLSEVIEKQEASVPSVCPCCGEVTTWEPSDNEEDTFLICENPACSAQAETAIQHHFKIIKCDNFGDKAVNRLVSNGFISLESIYSLDVDGLQSIGFGPGTASNIRSELDRVTSEPIDDNILLGSLGIKSLGRGNSGKLLAHYKINDIAENGLSEDSIKSVKGFDKTSSAISRQLQLRGETLRFLLDQGFVIRHTKDELAKIAESGGSLSGVNVVFTGTMVQGKRDDMKKQAKAAGATVQSGVNGKTDILVCGEKVGAAKLDAAKTKGKDGIEIITEAEYLTRFFG